MKISLGYLERRPFYFATGDSPGVKVYHFASIFAFLQSNCTLLGIVSAPHFVRCQPDKLKP
ncbi:hypothetical protein DWU89_18145 [Parabacteroides acidifaciens]|uniref:Uncharacterized protein n=1 Tax=Parabacteroides acidifaciens TaxID=2290935 RepID=A0A3D8HAN3_9BACT|nr:hypothetical protein DWU89_18145 [Parabacteroides acidifaciens]